MAIRPLKLKGEKALKQAGAHRSDGHRRDVFLLAVLLVAVAVSNLLDTPKVGAFPQSLTRDYSFMSRGFGDMATVDVNRDGHLDFILSERSLSGGGSAFNVYLFNPTDGEFRLNATIRIAAAHSRMIVDDIDNDGRVDIVALTAMPSAIQVFIQDSSGFASSLGPGLIMMVPGAIDIATGALTGSALGHDIAVVYPGNVTVYSYLGYPRYFDPIVSQSLDASSGIKRVLVSDADGDELPDLILASPYRVKVFYGTAGYIVPSCTINCREYPILVNQSGSVSISIADVTSDGKEDMILAISDKLAYMGTIVILARDEDPTFRNFTMVFSDSRDSTDQLTAADFNYDGLNDIAVILSSTGNVAFFYQQPDGTFRNRVDLQLNGTTSFGTEEYIVSGDFAGGSHIEDGYQDIAIRARVADNSTVSIFHQEDRSVGFSRPIPYQCPNDCHHFNQGATGIHLINLDDYFQDDHGPIVYLITYQERPADLEARLDSDGHHLDFAARSGWYGVANFRVAANDLYPGHQPIESNEFTVMVNAPPMISSTPTVQVTLGDEYRYLPSVNDPFPTGDYHKFHLLQGPPDASMDVNSGLLRWTPTGTGNFTLAIEVVDSFAAISPTQRFTVTVLPRPTNPPPDTISIPIPRDTTPLAAIGVSVTAFLMIALIAAVSENAKYALLILFIPLYSKIRREKVLDHFIRGQIFGYIMANPGEHYNSIKQALDITNGSLAHHLRTLERERFVKSKRFGLYRRFYPWAMRVPEDGYFQLNEIQKNILDLCRHQPAVSQKELAASLNLTPPTINYHISILAEHGYVRVIRRGRRTQVYVLKGGKDEAH